MYVIVIAIKPIFAGTSKVIYNYLFSFQWVVLMQIYLTHLKLYQKNKICTEVTKSIPIFKKRDWIHLIMRLVPYDYYKIRFHISKEKSFRFRLHFIGHVPAWLVQCINQTAIRLHRWCGCCVLRKSECSPLFFFFLFLLAHYSILLHLYQLLYICKESEYLKLSIVLFVF